NSLMLHGIIYAQQNPRLDTDPGHDFANEVHSYFATGTELQEMYITPSLLSAQNWDTLAEAAKWSRANADVLRDVHWIGGDPGRLNVYGWAAWSSQKAIVTFRNPDDQPQLAVVDLQRQLQLPPGVARHFSVQDVWHSGGAEVPKTLDAACGGRAWGARAPATQASFALDMSRPGRRVDPNLASLSYETLELSDPTFFAADNHGLVRMFREMNPHGVLRIGGNTSDDTVWGGYKGSMPTYVPRRHGKLLQPHVLKPEGLQALAGFVRATGWKLVFGVNLRIGSPAMAVDLAQTVQRLVGDQLLAIQIGNEANNYEPDYAAFDAAWTPYAKALRAAGLPIAGPDTGANTDWV